MAGRTLVIGDIHGAHKALIQVLERANFEPASDEVIFLGDVCDGWSEVPQSIQQLLEIGARSVWGNHDQWAWNWMLGHPNVWEWSSWISQGGRATFQAFKEDPVFAKTTAAPYFHGLEDYIHDEDRGFVYAHGGIPLFGNEALGDWSRDDFTWDRDMFFAARAVSKGDVAYTRPLERNNGRLTPYQKVFIGHTPTYGFSDKPVEVAGVVLMDTGASWEGKLSMMDVDTGEVWQSDQVSELYPEEAGRRS